jgi:hypothetical protein
MEKADGWTLLWDGKTTDGWRSPSPMNSRQKLAHRGRRALRGGPAANAESQAGGDIITPTAIPILNSADFMITTGCNSGIKIFVQPNISPIDKVTGKPTGVGSAIGLEYQILDDAHHPDAKLGRDGDRKLGALYDLFPCDPDKRSILPANGIMPALFRGHPRGTLAERQKILEYDRGSPAFRAAVALSKFKNIPISANGRTATSCCRNTAAKFPSAMSKSACCRQIKIFTDSKMKISIPPQFSENCRGGSGLAGIFPTSFPRAARRGRAKQKNQRRANWLRPHGPQRHGKCSDESLARVVAVCDLDSNRLAEGKKMAENYYRRRGESGVNVKTFHDYHDVLASPEIDAVVVTVPDHSHARLAIEAAIAGKHVYVQKPVTYSIVEAIGLRRAVEARKIILQTGSQQRSEHPWHSFRAASEAVRNGRIGQLKTIKIGLGLDQPSGHRPRPCPCRPIWITNPGSVPRRNSLTWNAACIRKTASTDGPAGSPRKISAWA